MLAFRIIATVIMGLLILRDIIRRAPLYAECKTFAEVVEATWATIGLLLVVCCEAFVIMCLWVI